LSCRIVQLWWLAVTTVGAELELFTRPEWQMALGERAAIAGVVAQLRPRLAVELGTAQGGSLRTIAEWSEEVHTFDFAPSVTDPPANATLHAGDSHVLLPQVLAGFARDGRNVDFALVDGDHSAAGVRQDVLDLLASPAVASTAIILHDAANEEVRAGLLGVDYSAHPKVRLVDFAFVELQRPRGALRAEWGGLGLILVGPPAGPPVLRNLERRQSLSRRLAAPARHAIHRARAAARARRRSG
jgi:Methyltransferase domain